MVPFCYDFYWLTLAIVAMACQMRHDVSVICFLVLQMLTDIVADSWLLLPVPLFFFTPGSIANLVCMYTGLAVPALNSMKVRLLSIP